MENFIKVTEEKIIKDSRENRYMICVRGTAGIWQIFSQILIPNPEANWKDVESQYIIETTALFYDRWGYVQDRAVKYSLQDAMNYVYSFTEEGLNELYNKDCERESR